MTEENKDKNVTKPQDNGSYKKFLNLLIGSFVLILGITLILAWWPDVIALIRGGLGIVLALAGLLVLYSLTNK